MATKHRGTLTAEERDERGRMISRDKAAARKLAHARILLQADGSAAGPAWSDERIADALSVSIRTIERVRRRFVAEDLGSALRPKPASGFISTSWTARQRPSSSLWLARLRPRARRVGRCGFWPRGWWIWRSSTGCAT